MLTYNSQAEHDKLTNHNPIRFADKCEMSAHILSSLHCPLCQDGVPYSIGSDPMDYEDDDSYPA